MEKVEIFVPKGYAGDEPNVFVSVGGVNYLLPRGKTSTVPQAVANELKRSWEAQAYLDARVERLLAK